MRDVMQSFGPTVRERRQDKGLSQEKLAELADLNRSYLGEIERGLVTPSLLTVLKLAEALDCSASNLLVLCERAPHGQIS